VGGDVVYTVSFEFQGEDVEEVSVTENLEQVWMAAGLDLFDLRGLEAHESLPVVTHALENLMVSPDYYHLWAETMGVTMGNSGFDDLLHFLEQVRDTCIDMPGARIDIRY
jgi:hypothetical protein